MKKNIKHILLCVILVIFSVRGFSQESEADDTSLYLEKIVTYVDSPVVEQRQILDRNEIQQMNVEDLPSLFQAAGIQILSYGSYGLQQYPSIRGFTDETVRVVVDGICVNNPQYGTFDFSSISTDDIECIEIVRGGFTEGVSDDGAVAGVIYITTKRQSLGHHFSTNTQLKTFFNPEKFLDTVSQSFNYNGQISENLFLKTALKAAYAQNEYLYQNYKNQTAVRKNASVNDIHSDVKATYFFGNGNSFSLGDITYAGYKNIPGSENSGKIGVQQDYNNNLNLYLNIPNIKNTVKYTANLNWLSTTRFYDDNTPESSRHYVNTFSFVNSADYYSLEHFKQSLGITLDYVNLNSNCDGRHNQFSGTIKETSKFLINDVFSFTVPLSVRFCGNNFAFTPKAGVKFHFQYLDVLLDAYRMVQFPNMDDLYWVGLGYHGNPDLKPESGWGSEITLNGHDIYIPFSFAVFTNYYENKIQWANSEGVMCPQNVASAFYLGFDFSFEKTFFKIWKLKGNVEYLCNWLLDKSNELTYGKRIMWTPDLVFSLISLLDLNPVTLTAELNYTGKKYTSNINTVFVDPYCLVNVSGELKVWKNVIPYFRIDNLFNVDYEAIPDYPMPGISLTLGVKTNW